MSYFSEKIKKLRSERGLTQKDIANTIGISQGNYSSLENGKNEPSLSTLQALSDYYNEFIDTLVRPIRIIEEDTEDTLSNSEKNLLRKFRQLAPYDKYEIETLIELKLEKELKRNFFIEND